MKFRLTYEGEIRNRPAAGLRDIHRIYEAAHSLLVRSKKWSSLRAWGMTIAKRRGMARARVAVAIKLATILHRMWVDGVAFRFGKENGSNSVSPKLIAVTA
jgi:hypothetical protein